MGICIDLHVHTNRYSACSLIDPHQLVKQAAKIGLDGVVITEHHHQWSEEELKVLLEEAGEPNFLLLAGFEYGTGQGDVLIYGLTAETAASFAHGLPPETVVEKVHELGGVCVAAHPTRMGMGFDERIASLSLDAIEVQSVNMKHHEQRIAIGLSAHLGIPATAGSDAHQLEHVGRYTTAFDDPIQSMRDLQIAFQRGRFHVFDGAGSNPKAP